MISYIKENFILIGLLVLAITLFFIYTPKTGENVVELRDNGFHPKEMRIQEGEVVKFTSKRGRMFWPASNIHPAHGIYPEFDSKEPMRESWTFQFNKTGKWNYHDHLAPYFTGTIVVLGESDSDLSKRECDNKKNSVRCWQETLIAVLDEEGIDATFDRIAELYNEDAEFAFYCHYLTHNIGIAAYSHYLDKKDSVLTPQAAFCANGFYHGFMEAFLSASLNPQKASEFCEYVDKKLTPQAPDAALQCYHGIGHGAMDMAIILGGTGGDERDMIAPALKLCRDASDTEDKLYRCASGIFNGIANFYITGEYGFAINEEDPFWLCREQPEEYKRSCYGNMNSAIFWFSGNDFLKAARYAETIEDDKLAALTTEYLGAIGALYEKSDKYKMILSCRALQKRLRTPCLKGFVEGFLEHGTPGVEYVEALEFCRLEQMTQEERRNCFWYALDLSGWYPKEKIEQICATIEEEYVTFCR